MSFESRDILDEHLTEKGSKLQNEIQEKWEKILEQYLEERKYKRSSSSLKLHCRQEPGEEAKDILCPYEKFPLGRPEADFQANALQILQRVTQPPCGIFKIWYFSSKVRSFQFLSSPLVQPFRGTELSPGGHEPRE